MCSNDFYWVKRRRNNYFVVISTGRQGAPLASSKTALKGDVLQRLNTLHVLAPCPSSKRLGLPPQTPNMIWAQTRSRCVCRPVQGGSSYTRSQLVTIQTVPISEVIALLNRRYVVRWGTSRGSHVQDFFHVPQWRLCGRCREGSDQGRVGGQV